MISALLVFLGGGLGSLCRYLLAIVLPFDSFPKGTLAANLLSCLILGILIGLYSKQILNDYQRVFLMTGFCGGFSTFSTYNGEILQLYQSGHPLMAASYALLSVFIGIAAIIGGIYLSKFMN
jgi:CrcB protein